MEVSTDTKGETNLSSVLEGFDHYSETQKNNQQIHRTKTYQFTPKHRYSIKNNPLCGICLTQWLSILRQRHMEIEWLRYWPRLLFLTFMSIINSLLAIPEWLIFRDRIQSTTLNPSPVFILGHPRTGTTLLHSLLALDDNEWAVCSTFCAGFPSSFLWLERCGGKRLFRGVIDDHRPMDNVKLDFDLPQEDEIATNVISGGISPYMPLFLMRQELDFRAFYDFEERSATKGIGEKKKRWINAFLFLCRKLTLRAAIKTGTQSPRLLLKSPVHTARIKLLLQLFPEAQFIYIHRHPYDVFRSASHMADTTYWYTYLNTPTNAMIQEFILNQYEILWETYEEGRQLLQKQNKSSQLLEVSFDDLTQDTIETMKAIYTHFGWLKEEEWAESEILSKLKEEISAVRSYQRNSFRPLHPTLEQIIDERWGASFDRLGYHYRSAGSNESNKKKTQ